MEYILISMLTISVFTYIVYMLANKILAVQMHIKFLILCAFCAFSMSLILPRMFVGVVGLAGTSCIIILFGLISSYFIARYYDAELQQKLLKDTLATSTADTAAIDAIEISMTMELDPQDFFPSMPAILPESVVEKPQEPTEAPAIITEPVMKEYSYPVAYKEEKEDWKLVYVENFVQVAASENLPVLTEIEVKEYCYPIIYKEGIITSFLEQLSSQTEQEKIEEFLDNISPENQEELKTEDMPIEVFDSEIMTEEVVSEEFDPSSTDLDALMDIAFSQKEQRNFIDALRTFRQALFLYPNSEVSPFLTVEIGSILKNLGSYDEAIAAFTEGRLLPGVSTNTTLDQEFVNNIAYLQIAKNTLTKNSLEFMPLHQVPSSILTEIDHEFSQWRTQS